MLRRRAARMLVPWQRFYGRSFARHEALFWLDDRQTIGRALHDRRLHLGHDYNLSSVRLPFAGNSTALYTTVLRHVLPVQGRCTRGVDPGGWGSWPLKICRRGRSMFCPLFPKNVTFFHSKLLVDNSASFTSSRTKDLCQRNVILFFRGAYIQAVRNRDCWLLGNRWRRV